MGTNFYAFDKHCSRCGQLLPEGSNCEEIHLGKSSIGWKFTLQANRWKYYNNWLEMKGWLAGKPIKDEYGKDISLEEFIEWVENRKDVKEPETFSDTIWKDGYKFADYEFF